MLSTQEMHGIKVRKKPGSMWSWGKVWRTVFSPDGKRVVGFIIKRPDLLWAFKRADKFLALDAFEEDHGAIVATQGALSWDQKAIRRLDLDWDQCIIWEGMDVKTTSGKELGHVGALTFNTQTGAVGDIVVTDGAASRALIGNITIPADHYLGYRDGFLIVDDQAGSLDPEGGLAAQAGRATAKAAESARQVGKKLQGVAQDAAQGVAKKVQQKAAAQTKDVSRTQQALTKQATEAYDQGTYALGKQLGKTKGMFSAFKEEFKKAQKDED